MIRILHLLPADADFQTRYSVQRLSAHLGPEYRCQQRTIGRGGDWRGVAAAMAGLRKLDQGHIVHIWGGAGLVARALCGRELPVVYTPPAGQRWSKWLHILLDSCQATVVCASASSGDRLLAHGLPSERCHLVRPGVDWSAIGSHGNPELRTALGLAADDVVLLAAGESTVAAGHRDAVWAAGIVHVLDSRYKLLLWGQGPALPAVEAFSRRLGSPGMVRIAQKTQLGQAGDRAASDLSPSASQFPADPARRLGYEALLSVADIVLAPATSEIATLPICMSMAAGVPIVATATPTISEILEDRHTALLVHKNSPRILAQRIIQLRQDSNLRWRLADRARAEAYDYYTMSRFVQEHREVYQNALRHEVAEAQRVGTR